MTTPLQRAAIVGGAAVVTTAAIGGAIAFARRDDGPQSPQKDFDPHRHREQRPDGATRPTPEQTPTTLPPRPPQQPGNYTNPVFLGDTPDPAVVRGDDGAFYAYTTEANFWPMTHSNHPVLRSTDLVNWKLVGDAFAPGTEPTAVTHHHWAPHVSKTGDHYTMLYSGRGDDGKMRIGYATAAAPQGPFQDRGELIPPKNFGYTIDPFLLQEDNRWFLYWGSGPEGITAQEVGIKPDGAIDRFGQEVIVMPGSGRQQDYERLVEGAWMHKRDGWYYLMYSGDDWQGHYTVKAARSRSPLGPFEKQDVPLVESGNGFRAPGHHSMITDDAGQDWILYHAWVDAKPDVGRSLMLDKVDWANGWPVINGGKGPSATPQTGPVVDAARSAEAVQPQTAGATTSNVTGAK